MFYLVNTANETVRKAVSKVSLRRFRRKANDATLRIIEGDSPSKALKAEEKAALKASKEVDVKAVKKAAKKHAAEVSSEGSSQESEESFKEGDKEGRCLIHLILSYA